MDETHRLLLVSFMFITKYKALIYINLNQISRYLRQCTNAVVSRVSYMFLSVNAKTAA
jgi:hypothetical protein